MSLAIMAGKRLLRPLAPRALCAARSASYFPAAAGAPSAAFSSAAAGAGPGAPGANSVAEDAFEFPEDAPSLRRPRPMEVASTIVAGVKEDKGSSENVVRARAPWIPPRGGHTQRGRR